MADMIKFPAELKDKQVKLTPEEAMLGCMVAIAEGITTLAAWADQDGMSRGFWKDGDASDEESA